VKRQKIEGVVDWKEALATIPHQSTRDEYTRKNNKF
jgi:hypothetical protein